LARGKIITIINLHFPRAFIVIGDGGSWNQRLHSNRRCNIGVHGGLLTCLLLFIGVAEDDHLAIAEWSEEVAVEVAKQSFGEPCVS
jgi:hypothetical protein